MITASADLLGAALQYHAFGWAVLPVAEDKRPVEDVEWGVWLTRAQTRAEVEALPWDRAHGIGILTWPASDLVGLDHDGAHGVPTWAQSGIDLPPTASVQTRSGGLHLIFRVPAETPRSNSNGRELRRRVRLVRDSGCGCRKPCGVDLLLNGYFVTVPTPGYRENPDHPLEPGSIATIPAAVLQLAKIAGQDKRKHASTPSEQRIPDGQRDTTLTSLAGTMRRRGMSEEAILAALREENARRCDPPLPEADLRKIARSVGRYEPAGWDGLSSPEHLTDLGNARRLVALHGRDLRYCFAWKTWLAWDGRRWQRDDSGEAFRRAKDMVRAIYTEASACVDEEQRKAIAKHAARCEADSKVRAILSMAESEPELVVRPEEFDRDPMQFNGANGTVDLRTGTLRAHVREDLIAKQGPITYDPKATAPTWDRFLRRIFADNVDLIGFVQRAVGYSLTANTREQVWFLLHGPGANGKTTFLRTLTDLFGDYAAWTPTQTLLAKRGEHIENDLARLRGARLVAAIEAEGGRRLAEALVKQLTGGDAVTARFLYGEYFTFIPTFKLWFGTNHKPEIRGTDHAVWRRIRLIPFAVVIPEAEQDRDLPEKLRAEFPGILRWAVEGCLAWQRKGLGASEPVRRATADYREAMDIIGAFLSECCMPDPEASVGATDLYRAYLSWCEQGKEHAETQTRFGEALSERGYRGDRHRVTGRKVRVGLRLLSEQSEQSEPLFGKLS